MVGRECRILGRKKGSRKGSARYPTPTQPPEIPFVRVDQDQGDGALFRCHIRCYIRSVAIYCKVPYLSQATYLFTFNV